MIEIASTSDRQGCVRVVRPARNSDVDELRTVERAAGEAFRLLGMHSVADDEPPSTAALRRFIDAGRAWVVERGDQVAAYVIADIVDGCVHVEQVSVHPDHAHQRLGATLIDHLAAWSIDHGYPALTLTTFRDVPWNGPYYERCGFHWMADPDITPGLRELRSREAAHGLDSVATRLHATVPGEHPTRCLGARCGPSTGRGEGKNLPRHSQPIAQRGPCRKARVISHNSQHVQDMTRSSSCNGDSS